MKYIVDVKDISYGRIEVEADSVEEAQEKAEAMTPDPIIEHRPTMTETGMRSKPECGSSSKMVGSSKCTRPPMRKAARISASALRTRLS